MKSIMLEQKWLILTDKDEWKLSIMREVGISGKYYCYLSEIVRMKS